MYSTRRSADVSDVCRACAEGDLTVLKILAGRGAPLDSLCSEPVTVRRTRLAGWPPVRVAAHWSQFRALQFLLEQGADPNTPSLDGVTALHDAVEQGNLLMIDILLQAGADVSARDDNGDSSIDLARSKGDKIVLVKLIQSSMNSRGEPMKSPTLDTDEALSGQRYNVSRFYEFADQLSAQTRDALLAAYTPSAATYGEACKQQQPTLSFGTQRYPGLRGGGDNPLEERVAQLERAMKEIVEKMGSSSAADSKAPGAEPNQKSVRPAAATPDLSTAPVLLRNPLYKARYPVPEGKRSWDEELPGYAPILFSAEVLYTSKQAQSKQDWATMLYDKPVWADDEIYGMSQEDRDAKFHFNAETRDENGKVLVNRKSYLGEYRLHPVTGVPLNPSGRTGMVGRGLLGKYGPNHAADPVVTIHAVDSSGQKVTKGVMYLLRVAVITRADTGELAFPGGMVDPGETRLSATAVREFCEEAVQGDGGMSDADRQNFIQRFNSHSRGEIVKKVVDDPRNTDNTWMETQAFWFHFETESDIFPNGGTLNAGDDAVGASWKTIDDDFPRMYGDHENILIAFLSKLDKLQRESPETAGDGLSLNVYIPQKYSSQFNA